MEDKDFPECKKIIDPFNDDRQSAKYLLSQAQDALESNNYKHALTLLSKAKAKRRPIQGNDYLRAICFLRMNQPHAAKEALLEELRYFPNHQEAKNLLSQILTQYPQMISGQISDKEFQGIFHLIRPFTMLSEERLYSIFSLAKRVCIENITGDFVECGVAAGGSTVLLAYLIKKYSKNTRYLYAFDSFDGMPEPTEYDKHNGLDAETIGWGTGTCSAPEDVVRELCIKFKVSDIVRTVKGYFNDTLPKMCKTVGPVAFLHMDGDWYESTKVILQNLYDLISVNGIIQVDDYGYWEGCKKAIHEFEAQRNIKFEINTIDDTGIWFSKI
jgi:hypothetical protein